MLAKQGWRLLHFPDSLATKVLSSKYYTGGQFLKASTSRHPSLIWRSIMAAKPLLEEGLFWRIGNGAESVEHVLWECVAAMDVWCICSSKLQKQSKNQISFKDLLMQMVQDLEDEVLMEVAVVAWKIWRRRNDLVFNQTFSSPQFIMRQVAQKIEDLATLSSQQTTNPATTIPQAIQWNAPPANVYKVNWDSAVGVGTIIRDWEGRVIACMRMCRPLFPNPSLAEAFGALHSVKLAFDIGLKQIKLEGDAVNVVNDIKGNKASWKQSSLIISDIKQMLQGFDSFLVDFTPRSCNSLAHYLARDALHITDVLVDIEDVPYCIASLL
ncbi:uncharacterized protein LOC122314582 [Carya illinoinensis]|uniref:uncharacterized protein LOC122314582 n=1 Tax=Carya illinoinensis TaxID=32201 RepID=UPI001C7210D8|nr:uncharacterized protein LOC122314582 [Carya illinoinensis]